MRLTLTGDLYQHPADTVFRAGCDSPPAVIQSYLISPRALPAGFKPGGQQIWCHSKADSIVWMKEDASQLAVLFMQGADFLSTVARLAAIGGWRGFAQPQALHCVWALVLPSLASAVSARLPCPA